MSRRIDCQHGPEHRYVPPSGKRQDGYCKTCRNARRKREKDKKAGIRTPASPTSTVQHRHHDDYEYGLAIARRKREERRAGIAAYMQALREREAMLTEKERNQRSFIIVNEQRRVA